MSASIVEACFSSLSLIKNECIDSKKIQFFKSWFLLVFWHSVKLGLTFFGL
jgi:hypothetical protein